ncbi:Lin0368 family putative glycerol transporter subunit [Alkaliphilus hydrothermalis]|uniref:Uncharacterized protein n=1 Tax=Alkaliphilus hydrothermalis TaxID=1482730 RepID=A0ABS2NTG4_9FIRM|nr:hypothetical protein [Alkaliphilus hydrothermalis]MBM7616052.1 hypothetical protein [Alkaliphilus hydrothermalis]
MRNFSTIIGGAIAGIFVMGVWGKFVVDYGIAGGWFAALVIIGTMWFLNHHIGILHNPPEGAWVDMGLAIGVCGMLIPVFRWGSVEPLVKAIPTLTIVTLGAIAGGISAAAIQKDLVKEASDSKKS